MDSKARPRRRSLLAVSVGLLLVTPRAAQAREDRDVSRLRAAVRIVGALDRNALSQRCVRAMTVARRLVQRSRQARGVDERGLAALSAELDTVYARSADLQRTHRLLTEAGLIPRLRELGMRSGHGREGPFGNAIKEPLPELGYDPGQVKRGITVEGRFVAAPIRPLEQRKSYHWTTDAESARRVKQQGFAISDVPSVNEGGKGVYVGPDPVFWKPMGGALLRVQLDPQARSFDLCAAEGRAFYKQWATAQRLDGSDAQTLERFCRTFGVDVLRMGDEACVIKSGRAIRGVR